MTKKSPRIYTYKITFEEVPYYYYGVKKEKYFNQKYFGSPVTHKWCWEFYTPKKQILEIFDYTDEGYCKAFEVEKRLIKPVLNDKWCLNENVGGVMSLSSVRKVGENHFKNCTGCFSMSKEERTKLSKEIVERNKKNKVGLFGMNKQQIIDAAKLGGQKSFEMKTGIFSLTEQQIKELNQKLREEKRGIYSISKERRSEISRMSGKKSAKIINSQRWECSETGYISTPAGLTHYQKSRGIDTSKRERIE